MVALPPLVAQANLNIAIVMQTFENPILQNCSTEFYDIAHTYGPWVCVIIVAVHQPQL